MHTREDYLNVVIPYRMRAVDVFNIATRLVMKWKSAQPMEMYIDGKISIRGLSTAFTNPVIEAGLVHCRALLEFMGLKCDKNNPGRLAERVGKRPDDFVIEDFSGPTGKLQKVSVNQAIAAYDGPSDEAEEALAAVIHAASKGMAHTTSGLVVDLASVRLYEIASRGVPTLLVNHFYVAQGLEPPGYKISATLQNPPNNPLEGDGTPPLS